MLAAHRDQENLVHGHQQTSKQQPKTPGARFAKTPARFNQHGENIATVLGKKNVFNEYHGGKEGTVTPTDARSRAPLGNKTTNAKARTGQTGGGKNIAKGLDKAVLNPVSTRKAKQKAPVLRDTKTNESDSLDDTTPEPEYAPPRPADLPFESDILPKGGLSMDGLLKENMYRGFYQQFCNPIDGDGISAQTKRFNKEMEDMMKDVLEKNAKEMDALDWNKGDFIRSPKTASCVPNTRRTTGDKTTPKVYSSPSTTAIPGFMRRKAPVTGPQSSGTSKSTSIKKAMPLAGQSLTRKPFNSNLSRKQPASKTMAVRSTTSSVNGYRTSASVSRNTLGYSKGRPASSVLKLKRTHNQERISPNFQDEESLDIGPSRACHADDHSTQGPPNKASYFASVFDALDDEELPPMLIPDIGFEEEQFELKLDD